MFAGTRKCEFARKKSRDQTEVKTINPRLFFRQRLFLQDKDYSDGEQKFSIIQIFLRNSWRMCAIYFDIFYMEELQAILINLSQVEIDIEK